jgi:hypothetical protein
MNGFDVLRLLAQESDLTLTDIANRLQRTGLRKS